MGFDNAEGIGLALQRVGELLQAYGETYHIVVIGGAAVNLLGFVTRATTDVDILAFAHRNARGTMQLAPPNEPLPTTLANAARTVAADMGLDPHWLNTGPASQWRSGLPPGLESRVRWVAYDGLGVGLVDRYDLIFLKLFAAVDDTGPTSVHFQDLMALVPTEEELDAAGDWVRHQDPSPSIGETLKTVMDYANTLGDRPR